MTTIAQFITHIGWRDLTEIIVISALFYYISLWLQGDKKSNLLIYFYTYCITTWISFLIDLPMLFQICFYGAPAFGMLFILAHQQTLQKNYITARTYTPAQHISTEWHNELIRCLLINRTRGIPLHVIIEHESSLESVLDSPFILNAPFQFELLQTLITSEHFDKSKFVWISNDGRLKSINAKVQTGCKLTIDKTIEDLPDWQLQALILSKKADVITMTSDPSNADFIIIFNETINYVSPGNSLKILKKLFVQSPYKGKTTNEQTKINKDQTFSS